MSEIKARIEDIRERIERAAGRAGRNAEDVRLMAVSKLKSAETVEEAYRAGLRLFGENRIQEAYEKFADFHADAELHIIGHLQSNKVRKAAEIAACVQSIDKLKTAAELQKRCAAFDKVMDIYLEFNTSGEDTKSGYRSRDLLLSDIRQMSAFSHLRIRGLMTIGPFTNNEALIRAAFQQLRGLFEEVRTVYPNIPMTELSMGMTSDFELAVEEGSTMVRVGTALFGTRS